jgi:hypothetical protein
MSLIGGETRSKTSASWKARLKWAAAAGAVIFAAWVTLAAAVVVGFAQRPAVPARQERIQRAAPRAGMARAPARVPAKAPTTTPPPQPIPPPKPAPPAAELESGLTVLNLSGTWKFKGDWAENGQLQGWEKPDFDDSTWRDMHVPGDWESQGVATENPRWPGPEPYNGYAWYRRHFAVPADWDQTEATLRLSSVDDMDWAYVNGKSVGSTTGDKAFEQEREYDVPSGLLKPGAENVVAVRVLDTGGKGGIVEEPVELARAEKEVAPEGPAPPPTGRYTETRGDMVQVVGSVVVPPRVRVNGDAVAVGGSVDVQGYVTGQVVAVGGSVWLREGSRVDGDIVAVGGSVHREGDAVVHGNVTQVSLFPWQLPSLLEWTFPNGPASVPAKLIRDFLLWGVLGLLLALLFPKRLQVMARALPLYPGWVAAHGVVSAVMTPAVVLLAVALASVVCVVLAITIIGIVLIPAVALALVCLLLGVVGLLLFGLGGLWLSVGQAITAHFWPHEKAIVPTVLVGVIVTAVASVIPVIGVLVYITLLVFAYGLAIMTGLGASPGWTHRRLRIPPAPEAPAAVQPPAS